MLSIARSRLESVDRGTNSALTTSKINPTAPISLRSWLMNCSTSAGRSVFNMPTRNGLSFLKVSLRLYNPDFFRWPGLVRRHEFLRRTRQTRLSARNSRALN